jgi:hypothetical protein
MKHHILIRSMIIRTLTLALPLFMFCQPGNAHTIEVSDDINNDTTWNADTVKVLNDIEINSGYTLKINPGTYIEFQGHYKIEIHGCLLAIGTKDSNIVFTVNDTTLFHDLDTTAGGCNGIDFYSTGADTSKLIYCTLEYGKATDGQPSWDGAEDSGGSVLCYSTGPFLIQNCTIRNSIAVDAAAVKSHNGNIILLNNVIKGNKAEYCAAVSIGYSEARVIGNTITNNLSTSGEGSLSLDNTNGLFANNIVVNNESLGGPGAIYVNSSITSRSFTFTNNIIANNRSHGNYGGIYVSSTGAHTLYKNNIIWNNQAEGGNYQFYPEDIVLVEYNNIQGGYTGPGNIDTDPMFVNPTEGTGLQYDGLAADWSLQTLSPCIDAGKPDFTTDSTGTETDFAGNPRIQYDIIDIGAFEITYCTPVIEPDPDNILINGSFGTCELLPWDVYTSDLLDKPAGYRIIDGECRVMPDGINPEPDPSDIQLLQELAEPQLQMLEADSAYELTFDARAEINDRPCKIFLGMNEEPFTALIDEDIMIGTETGSFSFGFTVSEIFPSMAFSFELGSDSSAVTFDNVRIIKVHGGDIDGIRQYVHPADVVFPNPADDYLKVFADEGADIKLYNSLGIPVETKISRNINIVSIDTKNLPGGVYFVEISNGKRTSVRKVIIR